MKPIPPLRGFLIVLLVAGCTSFTAHQVNPRADPYARGLLIPDQVPLLVVADGQVSTILIRSPDRATAIEFASYLAKHDVTLEFADNGALTKVTSNQDSTAIPLKLLEVAGSLAEHVLPQGKGLSGTDNRSTSLQVYRIVFDNGEIVRLEPLLREGENFPPLRLKYERTIADETPIGDVNKGSNPPAKGN